MTMTTRRQVLLISIATFAAGLLIGALILNGRPTGPRAPSAAASTEAPAGQPPPEAPPAAAADAKSPAIAAVRTVDEPGDETEQAAPAATGPDPGVATLLARLDDLSQGWGRMEAELAALRERIGSLEQRAPAPDSGETGGEREPRRPRTPEEQRDALLKAGVAAELAEDILWRRGQVSLERLNLRDQAIREGWLNTDRYREELRRVNDQRVSIRDEVGDRAYDRYLFETGQSNRVLVDSLIPGSAGEESGIQPGDVIERYGDQPVFDFRDLRDATSDGLRGELVPVTVRRGRDRVELWLPRGPIGIGLDATRVEPGT